MQLEHTFTVPAGVEQAWQVLLDIERIAPCMPGAAIDTVDGDDFTGTVKVRLGPIGLTYKGKATFVEKDAVAHRTVIDARGKDARGNGTATATITATLVPDGAGTAVTVLTDLNITGKPAQFGRSVMVDVGNKLIGQFADCLAGKLAGGDVTSAASSNAAVTSVGVTGAGVTGDALGGPSDEVTDDPESYVAIASFAQEQSAAPVGADSETSVYDLPTAEMSVVDAPVEEVPIGAASGETAPPITPLVESPPPTDSAVPAPSDSAVLPSPASGGQHRRTMDEVEPIDLLGSAGPAVAKRLAPVALGAVVVALVLAALRRRR
ncbi:SRPBCC family protein [Jatrophihabitans lederbergiae]|uniref:SRPBCC family protein n=1 Tax=Jatrophihabitans lederbergiae TaxID=3075547 RepID=A0ABU2J7D9_9ACTN|nr:SRPBCC family protein [Jatrophihabitans sp. DSM 44399]MDT0260661.1 SRPBCC family protein [Jatrophihabitans sp. DSM 44399]